MNEQLKIALAALEEIAVWDDAADDDIGACDEPCAAFTARKALREIKALTAPAEKCTYKCEAWPECGCAPSVAPEPAPVAYKVWHREAKHCFCLASELPTEFRSDTGEPDGYFGGKVQPLFAHPPREPSVAPEPVAWTTQLELNWIKNNTGRAGSFYAVKAGPNDIPLFAHPPRAPLTEEFWLMLDTALDALKYHQEQTRPIELTRVTIAAVETFISAHGIGGK